MHIRSKRKKLCTMMYKVTLCGCIYWLATPLHTTLAVTCCHSESPVACSWGLELQRLTALLCIVVLSVILLLTSAEWWIEGIELLQTYKDTLLWLNAETLERVPTPFFGKLVRCSTHGRSSGDYDTALLKNHNIPCHDIFIAECVSTRIWIRIYICDVYMYVELGGIPFGYSFVGTIITEFYHDIQYYQYMKQKVTQ